MKRGISFGLSGLATTLVAFAVLGTACGTDSSTESDTATEDTDQTRSANIRTSNRMYSIDDLKSAGVKTNKEYDVEELPGSDSAWRLIFNRLEYEARFYPDQQTAISQGIEYAEHVTGDDAIVVGDDVLWEEGAKDRRRCSRDPQTPHSGCSYSPRYWDFILVDNMILMCEGLESAQSIQNCEDLLSKIP